MKPEKIWFTAGLFSAVLLIFVLFSPSVFAQGNTSTDKSAGRYLQLFEYVFAFVQNNYVDEVDPRILYEGAMKGMLEALDDPYTSYIDPSSLMGTNLKDTTTGSFGGVGLSITKPVVSTFEKPAYVEVASPIEDSPGWKAGIQPGDLLLDIDGTDTAEITMEEVLAILRGPVGTDVTVTIRRGKSLEFKATLTRALIEVPTVKYAMMENGIGYLRIVEFTPLTPARVQDALDFFEKEGYTKLLIDLRNNPGGLITSVVDVANKFIDSGVIVSTRSRISFENREFRARPDRTTFDKNIPIVVLINRGAASASEILAGALKDYKLAYLVGETSYGKGSVQQVIDLLNGDAMKITMARYYTPSGANIDSSGIIPDREVLFPELTEAEEKALTDLLQTTEIADFVEANPELTNSQAEDFARKLAATYPVELRVLKRLVMQQFYRTHISPLYDLEYDIQLKAAVDILNTENIPELLKTTYTVFDMQQMSEKEAEAS
ncbi:S41 family peptidase [Brucepastera parasyntrophica]|uniref:S41 family peptidase n=1 Tax=Brucepastera parasyntrophica TaxID=2880008 RepID=UPI00210A39BB|nr:S41 family peptidase [Brucepastera parasyntrophica]ULQ60884.1 S41 family peptidase [Brucepastera parasyntrophica]